ncbi:MAG: NTP transferase domain-containing protein [Alkaliphilus sp.]
MITAIIMAAGFSSRMIYKNDDELSNKNKLLMKIKGKSLIDNILNIANEIDFSEKILIYKDEIIKQKAKELGFKTVFNGESQKGLSSSLKLGVLNAKPTEAYMFFVADQPLLSVTTVKKLKKTGDGSLSQKGMPRMGGGSLSDTLKGAIPRKTIFVPRYGEKSGTPTIFLVKWREELLAIEGDLGGREIVKNNLSEVLFVDIENAYEGFDIDTWEDYEVIRENEDIQ